MFYPWYFIALHFQLTQVNDGMSEYSQALGIGSQTATLLHMLQRHRDILQDYSQEYQKTKINILAVKEREDLLGAVFRDNKYVKWLGRGEGGGQIHQSQSINQPLIMVDWLWLMNLAFITEIAWLRSCSVPSWDHIRTIIGH